MKGLKDWHETSLRVERGLRHLRMVAADAALYADGHPKLRETLDGALTVWGDLLAERDELELKCIDSKLVYENVALPCLLQTTREMAEDMADRKIECIVFRRGLTMEELVIYAHYVRLSPDSRKQVGTPREYFRSHGVRHIEVFSLGSTRGTQEDEGAPAVTLEALRPYLADHLDVVSDLHREARVARVLDLHAAQALVDRLLVDCTVNSSLMLGICSIRERDEYTCTHSLNTCVLSMSLARYAGMDEDFISVLGVSCLLHDIGKMFVPDEILNKPGRLTAEEWEIMEHHTTYGSRFLLTVPNLPRLAPLVAYEHHMTLSGTGYPRPARTYRPSMASLIVAISDFYDALSTARSYKKAMPQARVVEMMEEQDELRMEPRLRRLFLNMVGRYPIGSVVRLDTGEVGVVSMHNPDDAVRPEVHIVETADGEALSESMGVMLDELSDEGKPLRSIVEALDPLEIEVKPLDVLQKVMVAGRGGGVDQASESASSV